MKLIFLPCEISLVTLHLSSWRHDRTLLTCKWISGPRLIVGFLEIRLRQVSAMNPCAYYLRLEVKFRFLIPGKNENDQSIA